MNRLQVTNQVESPWGIIQAATEIADGILSVSTASHGGYYLSPERQAVLERRLPGVRPYAGKPWYEEDEDWTYVALAFAEEFSAEAVFAAVRHQSDSRYGHLPAGHPFWATIFGQVAKEKADAFKVSLAGKWERGSCGTEGNGWRVSFYRGNESRTMFGDYPEQNFYSEEELKAAGYREVRRLGQKNGDLKGGRLPIRSPRRF